MTQLIIAGVETVLPQQFSVAVKRENPFFTKSGEYTYDCTLRLDNPVNQHLYAFLHRLNRASVSPVSPSAASAPAGFAGGSASLATRRTALLIADGHVYCRGTEVITKWTDQTVSIQIVSGESELNFFVGQDQKIEDLDLGTIGETLPDIEGHYDDYRFDLLPTQHKTYDESDYCLPTINAGGTILNKIRRMMTGDPGQPSETDYVFSNAAPQPYLCAILRRLLAALNYNSSSQWTNQLEQTEFKNLFLVNTVRTTEYAKMLPGWTVKDFLTEVEKLCGVVFVTDNSDPQNLRCDILMKMVFYQDARELPLNDVIDTYETEVSDDDSREAEFTASDVSYDLPSGQLAKLMKLPEGYLSTVATIEHQTFYDMAANAGQHPKAVHKVEGDERLYILTSRDWRSGGDIVATNYLMEVDQFKNLDREDNTSTLELKITPAPMDVLTGCRGEVVTLGEATGSDNDEDEEDEGKTIEQQIQDFSVEESKAGDLYCAFFNGYYIDNYNPLAYTDYYHAYMQGMLFAPFNEQNDSPMPEGSLRLQDLDADYYQGGYQIDTAHAVTFQTFDPNHIDVRQVYIIGNRRYVVRDVEETITAEGRSPLWKLTCYPINISDEAVENRWVLTRGVWDDGGAWLDDGRWNDTPNED